MIAYIKGTLTIKTPAAVIVETVAGIGYHINISLHTYEALGALGAAVKLHTYLYIKDNARVLYGFHTLDERQLFKQLISVGGVGCNTAQIMLSSLKPNDIRAAIVEEKVSIIKSIKGIGPKTAQRIIFDLKDKLAKVQAVAVGKKASNTNQVNTISANPTNAGLRDEALTALMALGISKPLAQKALNKVIRNQKSPIDKVQDLIKLALNVL
jgi:Holliday junction DNA helicase RuvA